MPTQHIAIVFNLCRYDLHMDNDKLQTVP
jgi:hypothetical protein